MTTKQLILTMAEGLLCGVKEKAMANISETYCICYNTDVHVWVGLYPQKDKKELIQLSVAGKKGCILYASVSYVLEETPVQSIFHKAIVNSKEVKTKHSMLHLKFKEE